MTTRSISGLVRPLLESSLRATVPRPVHDDDGAAVRGHRDAAHVGELSLDASRALAAAVKGGHRRFHVRRPSVHGCQHRKPLAECPHQQERTRARDSRTLIRLLTAGDGQVDRGHADNRDLRSEAAAASSHEGDGSETGGSRRIHVCHVSMNNRDDCGHGGDGGDGGNGLTRSNGGTETHGGSRHTTTHHGGPALCAGGDQARPISRAPWIVRAGVGILASLDP